MAERKVMLVDDMSISNEIMKRVICKAMPETIVFDFTLPEQALISLPAINPFIIFLDLNMPKMNGWEFLDGMALKGYTHKVFILTSSSNNTDKERSAFYSNVVKFLVKPVLSSQIASIFQLAE